MSSPDMADFCTSSKPDRPVPEGQPGGSQLVFGRLHGGRHTSHHRGHVDDRYSRSANHGTTLPISGVFVWSCGLPAHIPGSIPLVCSSFWVPG